MNIEKALRVNCLLAVICNPWKWAMTSHHFKNTSALLHEIIALALKIAMLHWLWCTQTPKTTETAIVIGELETVWNPGLCVSTAARMETHVEAPVRIRKLKKTRRKLHYVFPACCRGEGTYKLTYSLTLRYGAVNHVTSVTRTFSRLGRVRCNAQIQ